VSSKATKLEKSSRYLEKYVRLREILVSISSNFWEMSIVWWKTSFIFFLLMNVSYDLNPKSEILKAIVAMTGWNMHNIMQDSLFSVTMKKTFFKNLQICFEILDDLKCKNFSWHRYEFSSVYIVFELCSFINANSYAKFSRMHF